MSKDDDENDRGRPSDNSKIADSYRKYFDKLYVRTDAKLDPKIMQGYTTRLKVGDKDIVNIVVSKQLSADWQRFVVAKELLHIFDDVGNDLNSLVESLKPAPTKPEISVGMVIVPEKPVAEGLLVASASAMWAEIARELERDWTKAYTLDWRVWEEMIAGAYKKSGFDEVVLTPRSGDHGRDVIATKHGLGTVRILGSVKAYKPGHLVTKEEVHAFAGVVNLDPAASKGIFTTTSDFAPLLLNDPNLARAVPYRVELMNGEKLRRWLKSLASK